MHVHSGQVRTQRQPRASIGKEEIERSPGGAPTACCFDEINFSQAPAFSSSSIARNKNVRKISLREKNSFLTLDNSISIL